MAKSKYIYCDSSIFIAYFQNEAGRADIVEGVFEAVRQSNNGNSKTKIVTSALTLAEVAYYADERNTGHLSDDGLAKIDTFWNDRSIIEIVEFHEGIALAARQIIRAGFARNWKGLRSADAIQLASAQWVQAADVYTYDDGFDKFSPVIGIPIGRPTNAQLMLPMP